MKPLDQLFELDERQKVFSSTLDDVHAELKETVITSNAPDKVREIFDTAKNLCLFSLFIYEFHAMAELAGFLALEQALRVRAEKVNSSLAKQNLRKVMDRAIRDDWITEENVPNRMGIARARIVQRKMIESIECRDNIGVESVEVDEPTNEEVEREAREMKIVEQVCDAAIKIRNGLAHGEVCLMPHSHRNLRMTAGLINQLF